MQPEVSIIILNYNTPELTTACVQSVIAHTSGVDYEIILVDNASKPESLAHFNKYLYDTPGLTIVSSERNLGFGGGNNFGVTYAQGKYLFFLNSDTIVYENSVKILYDEYKRLEGMNKVGFLAPRLYYDREKTQKQMFGTMAPTKRDVFVYNIPGLKKIFKKRYARFSYADWDRESDREVGNAGGAVFFSSKKAFDDIGKFDERFFLYMEEFDTAMRFHMKGYHSFYTVKTSIIHLENQSPKVKRRKVKTSIASMMKFFWKYW